jgi:hypothetical protein
MASGRFRSDSAKRLARRLPFGLIELALFRREAAWLRFGIKRPGQDDPSVILFTMHKVASTFTHELLGYLNTELLGLRRMDWDKYIHNKFPTDTTTWMAEHVDELFHHSGYTYGPFRASLPIAELARYRVLMILRDPRDILTSAYFSEAFSHAPPLLPERLAELEERRTRVQAMSIDEFVIEKAAEVLGLLDDYRRISDTYAVRPLTYTQMMFDWDGFMDGVQDALGVPISQHHRDVLKAKGRIGEELGGNANAHLRRGTPGDHVDKLQPDTVRQLTAIFSDHLDWLGDDRRAEQDWK